MRILLRIVNQRNYITSSFCRDLIHRFLAFLWLFKAGFLELVSWKIALDSVALEGDADQVLQITRAVPGRPQFPGTSDSAALAVPQERGQIDESGFRRVSV